MKNYKRISIINTLLLCFGIFFTTLILIGLITKNLLLKIIVSTLFTIGIGGIIFHFDYGKHKRLFLKKSEQKKLNNFLFQLEIMPDNEAIALLMQIFGKANINARANKNYIILESYNCFFDFSFELKREAICNTIKKSKDKKILFFCSNVSTECESILTTFKQRIKIIDGKMLYLILQKYQINFNFDTQNQTPNVFLMIFKVLKNNFTKKRAVSFMLIGITLLLFSKFTFFPKYYLLSSLFCFITALTCLIFGKHESIIESEIFSLEP